MFSKSTPENIELFEEPTWKYLKLFTHLMSCALHIVTLKLYIILQRYILTVGRSSRLEVLGQQLFFKKMLSQ